jgi:hypothetical protein
MYNYNTVAKLAIATARSCYANLLFALFKDAGLLA